MTYTGKQDGGPRGRLRGHIAPSSFINNSFTRGRILKNKTDLKSGVNFLSYKSHLYFADAYPLNKRYFADLNKFAWYKLPKHFIMLEVRILLD